MDISFINKLSKYHGVNFASLDAEQIKSKVSQEAGKILETKIIHDSEYWQLRENYQQLGQNHERLQQNMVEVQMQYENVSGQYQKEIRLRPEILNKVAYTRQRCDVLQECLTRLKDTLTLCRTDQAVLNDANSKVGQVIGSVKLKQAQLEEKYRLHIHNAEEKVQLVCQERERLMQVYRAAQEQGSAEIQQLRRKVDSVEAERERLALIAAELPQLQQALALLQLGKDKLEQEGTKLSKLIERQELLLKQKDERNLNMEQHIQQLEEACTNTKNENFTLLQNLKEVQGANESLKHALANQSQVSEAIQKQTEQLDMQIATLKIDNIKLSTEITEQNLQLVNYKSELDEENQKLITAMGEHTKLQQEMANLITNLKTLQLTHDDTLKELVKIKEDLKTLQLTHDNTLKELVEKNDDLKTLHLTHDNTLKELVETKENLKTLQLTYDDTLKEMVETKEGLKTLQVIHDDKLKELVETKEEFNNKIMSFETMILEERMQNDEKCATLATIIETKDKTLKDGKIELNELAEAIAQLKRELDEEGSKVQREKEKRSELEREHARHVKYYELQAEKQEQKIIENSNIITKLKVDKKVLDEKVVYMQGCMDRAHSLHHIPEQDIANPNVAVLTQAQVPLQSQCKKRCMSPRHLLGSDSDNRQTQFDVRGSQTSRRGGYQLPHSRVEGDGVHNQPSAGSTLAPLDTAFTTQTPAPSVQRRFFKSKRLEAYKRSN